MGQLIGVHGIGQQYQSRPAILLEWENALIGGLEAASGRRRVSPPNLDVAFYGDLFRPDPDPGRGSGKGTVEEEALAKLADLDADELAELTETVEEIVSPDDLASAREEAESGKGVRLVFDTRLPVSVVYLIGAVERGLPPTSAALFLGDLRQVGRYLRDTAVKAEVDRITAMAAVNADILIGHSLGSVVAYEYLRQHPGHSVRLLVTIGSPLSLRMVRKRIPSVGVGDAQWVNIRDVRDPVTAGGPVDRWYPGVREARAVNGSDAHGATRYLNSKACGRALLAVAPGLAR